MGYVLAFIGGCLCGAVIGALALALAVAARFQREVKL